MTLKNRMLSSPLGPLMVTAYLSMRRERCRAICRDGAWVLSYRDGIVVSPRPGVGSPSMQERTTRDHYIWGSTLHRGNTVLDVGAGIGSEMPTFSKDVGDTGRVIAIEAHPVTFGFLERNVKANRLDNVSVHQAAVTSAEGTIAIANDLDDHIGNSIVMKNSAGGVEVGATTLDKLIGSENIDSVALLKMNIEGAEVDALQGAFTTLSVARQVCICCHDFKADRTGDESLRTSHDVKELLLEAGFRLRLRPDDHRPWVRDTVYGSKR